eukprot:8678476-Karenia_brevis.AAC.1
MTTRDGDTASDRQSIADIFAAFYEELYKRRPPHNMAMDTTRHRDNDIHNSQDAHQDHNSIDESPKQHIQQFTQKELHTAMTQPESLQK